MVISYLFPPRGGPEQVQEGRHKVLKSAKKYNREDKIAFMTGTMMGPAVTEVHEFTRLVERAITNGNSYFLPSFGFGESSMTLMKEFAKDIIPSFK